MLLRCLKIATGLSLALATVACGANEPPPHLRVEGSDPGTGRQLISEHGCGACHMIPGIPGAVGAVGPPLTNFAQRTVLAGAFPNVPRLLVPWLMNPQALQPETAMPNVGLTVAEARHMASYLYSLGAEVAVVYVERATDAQHRWISEAEAYQKADRRRLNETARVGPQHARIPIERAMELLATRPQEGR